MIQPLDQAPAQQPLVYEIVESERLPCFDGRVMVKNVLLSDEAVERYDYAAAALRPFLLPCYLLVITLCNFVLFVPAHVGRVFDPVCLLTQTLTNLVVCLSSWSAYVKVPTRTFEFWYLMLATAVWIVCAFHFVHNARSAIFLIAGIDFVIWPSSRHSTATGALCSSRRSPCPSA